MRFESRNWLVVLCLAIGLISARTVTAQIESVQFAEQARAVFKKRCVSCHSESQARGGLDMTNLEGILAGSSSGAVVVPGKPEESLVFTLAAHQDTPKMPPNAPKIPQRELNAIASWIRNLSLSDSSAPNASAMAALGDGEDRGRDTTTNEGLVPITPLPGPLAITALDSSKSLLAVSGLHQVLLYDTSSEQWLGALSFPDGDIFSIKFSSDGKKLVAGGGVGGMSGSIVCWDLPSYRRVTRLSVEDDVVLAMDISPDGKTLAVGGPKRMVEVIDLATGSRRHVLRKHADWVTSLAFSPDGIFLASGDRFGSIYVWDVVAGTPFDSPASHAGAVNDLQFRQDSNALWSAGKDGQVQQWDLQRSQVVNRWLVSNQGIARMLVEKDQVLTIDYQRRLTAYDAKAQQLTQQTIDAELISLTVVPASARVLVGTADTKLLGLKSVADRPVEVARLPQRPAALTVSRLAPKPVERRLKEIESPKTESVEPISHEELIATVRSSLQTSRAALEKSKQSIAELESHIAELEQLIEKLSRP